MIGDENDQPDAPVDPAAPGSEYVPPEQADNAANPAAVQQKRRRAESEESQAEAFWKRTLADPVGRRELFKILQDAHTFEERFACGPNGFPQPEATWFEAGQQSNGQRLFMSWLRFDPDGTMLMLNEHDPRFAASTRRKKKGE